jgi:hypothetical protein
MKSSLAVLILTAAATAWAGNPTRSGSAGAGELLINPWARTAGWAEGNTANVVGIESMYGNVAGLAGGKSFTAGFSNTTWLQGSGIQVNAAALATPTRNGVLGIHVTNFDYGDIDVTTTALPDGGAGIYSPGSSVLGIAYAQMFTDNIYGGVNIKLYSSSISNLSATGMCFDAGVQYVAGKNRDFRFGITLRNIGPSFGYKGDGLAVVMPVDWGTYANTFNVRAQAFELPTQLAIGLSKDFSIPGKQKVTLAGNFISNSFKKDQFTFGGQYNFRDQFFVRGSYAFFDNRLDGLATEALSGPAMGFTFKTPMGATTKFALDYGYRLTNTAFGGIHTVGIGLDL